MNEKNGVPEQDAQTNETSSTIKEAAPGNSSEEQEELCAQVRRARDSLGKSVAKFSKQGKKEKSLKVSRKKKQLRAGDGGRGTHIEQDVYAILNAP